jgi:tRNA pseudouridine32 synthase/23S rRNA pseudouridine746 synthase
MLDYLPPHPSTLRNNWILYEDKDFVAIHKPAGLLSVPGKHPDHSACAVSYLQQTHPDALIVHRLDMDTSGILLLALNKPAHRALSIEFQERRVTKHYCALCHGQLLQPQGRVQLPMRCDWDNRPKQIVDFIHGRSAQTDWELVEQFDNFFSVKLFPITGRSHQLRVHMQSLGHPILGDRFYAGELAEHQPRLMLHAESLTLRHPTTGTSLNIYCPTPFNLKSGTNSA